MTTAQSLRVHQFGFHSLPVVFQKVGPFAFLLLARTVLFGPKSGGLLLLLTTRSRSFQEVSPPPGTAQQWKEDNLSTSKLNTPAVLTPLGGAYTSCLSK